MKQTYATTKPEVNEDGKRLNQKYARWTSTVVRPATQYTVRYQLRAGKKGTGRILGSVQCWPDSRSSMEESDRLTARIEADAQAVGYTCLPESTH